MKSATCEAPSSYSGPSGYFQFPHYEDKYTCCCGIHATAGANVIGILGLLYLVFRLFRFCFTPEWNIITYWDAIFDIPAAVCLILLFIGLNKKKAMYLVPYMVMTVIELLFIAVLLVLCAVAFHSPSNEIRTAIADSAFGLVLWMVAFLLLIAGLFKIWFLHIIYTSYRYLYDLEVYNSRRTVLNY